MNERDYDGRTYHPGAAEHRKQRKFKGGIA